VSESGSVENDIDEAAALWLQRLREPLASADVIVAFEEWRNADACHGEAFERIARIWDGVETHAVAPEILRMRRDALSHAQQLRDARPKPRRLWPYFAGAAWVAILAAVGANLYFAGPKPLVYTTEVGERQSLILTDNSHVDIDADSSVSVEFTGKERHISLLRGQAFFQVAKDRSRPFVVESQGRDVVATGTEFNVETLAQTLRVTLVEGHVLVRSVRASGGWGQVLAALEPGDEFTAGSPSRLAHGVNTLAITAWRHGKLMFDDTPVAEALAEMGRYSHETIAIDPSATAIRVSGVFTVGDMAGLSSALESYYPVKLVADGQGNLTLTRR
jgi:transmembrane sensor